MSIIFLNSTTVTQGAIPTTALLSDQFGLKQALIPAFAAYNGSAAGGGGVVTWSNVEFDTRGNFNASNGRFTVPVAGYYYFKYHQLVNYATAGEYRVNIRINGVGQWGRSILYKNTSNSYTTLHSEARYYLNVGDYVDIYIEAASGVMATDSMWSFFQGYRA